MDTAKKHTCHPQYPAHKRIRSHATEFDTNLLIVTVHGDGRLYLSATLLSPSSAKNGIIFRMHFTNEADEEHRCGVRNL